MKSSDLNSAPVLAHHAKKTGWVTQFAHVNVKLPHMVAASLVLHCTLIALALPKSARDNWQLARQPEPLKMQMRYVQHTNMLGGDVAAAMQEQNQTLAAPAANAGQQGSKSAVVQNLGEHKNQQIDVNTKSASEQKASALAQTADSSLTGRNGVAAREATTDGIKDSALLDSSPQLLSDVVIEYPLSANDREGVVTLELILESSGKVRKASVIKATPAGFFEAAAVKGFQSARFSPGLFQGLGVETRLLVEVDFMPTNRGGSVAGPK